MMGPRPMTSEQHGQVMLVLGVEENKSSDRPSYILVTLVGPDGTVHEDPFFIYAAGWSATYEQERLKRFLMTALGIWRTDIITWRDFDDFESRAVGVYVRAEVSRAMLRGEPATSRMGKPIFKVNYEALAQDPADTVHTRAAILHDRQRPAAMKRDKFRSWDDFYWALVSRGVDADRAAEVVVAWDRDCADLPLGEICIETYATGKMAPWVALDPPLHVGMRCIDWCEHHGRWERVVGRTSSVACLAGLLAGKPEVPRPG
jgi:hypothetical protein